MASPAKRLDRAVKRFSLRFVSRPNADQGIRIDLLPGLLLLEPGGAPEIKNARSAFGKIRLLLAAIEKPGLQTAGGRPGVVRPQAGQLPVRFGGARRRRQIGR